MGRLMVGIGLAVVAIAMAVAGAVSIYTPLLSTWSLSDRQALALSFYDGRFRVFYFRTEVESVMAGPLYARFPPGRELQLPILGAPILPRIRVAPLPLPEAVHDDIVERNRWQAIRQPYEVRLGNRRAVADFGGRWRGNMSFPFYPVLGRPPAGEFTYFRLPVWLPVSLLILFPVRSMIMGPWRERRRRKRNQCLSCGYQLYGLTEPRCPECGDACEVANPGGIAVPQ